MLSALFLSAFSVESAETNNADGRPVPTVEGCVEKTGKTESECQEMMEKFKNMAPPEKGLRGKRSEGSVSKNGNNSNELKLGEKKMREGESLEGELERAKRIKVEKEEQFKRVKTRIEKIIEFLNSKDADMEELENNLATFQEKVESVTNAYSDYIDALAQDINAGNTGLSDESKNKRTDLQNTLKDLFGFYRSTLRENIKIQLEKIYE